MFKHTVRYKNFHGVDSVKTLTFAVTKSNLARMGIERSTIEIGEDNQQRVNEGLGAYIQNTVASGSGAEIWELFQWLLRNSYGVIAEDGESFDQGEDVFERWTKTASYDAFMSELMESETLSTDFMNNIFPFRVTDPNADPEFKRHREELEKRRNA